MSLLEEESNANHNLQPKENTMKKYLIYYYPKTRDGRINHEDVEKCWVYANNADDAEWRARDDNWDVGEIVDVRLIG